MPWITATTATRNPTDTMIPSSVKNERSLWLHAVWRAWRMASERGMDYKLRRQWAAMGGTDAAMRAAPPAARCRFLPPYSYRSASTGSSRAARLADADLPGALGHGDHHDRDHADAPHDETDGREHEHHEEEHAADLVPGVQQLVLRDDREVVLLPRLEPAKGA